MRFLLAMCLLAMSATLQGSEAKRECVIWYVCEPAPSAFYEQNLKSVLDCLRSSDFPEHLETADRIAIDQGSFLTACQIDRAGLIQALARHRTDAVLFTNAHTRSGLCEVFEAKTGSCQEVKFTLKTDFDQSVLRDAPQSHRDTLQAALAFVRSRFSPSDYVYTLILKGHGGKGFSPATRSLAPLISIDATVTECAVIRRLSSVSAADQAGDLPDTIDVGIDHDQLLTILRNESRMKFEFVFQESCYGMLPERLRGRLPPNVAMIWGWPDILDYQNIDYAQLSANSTTTPPFSRALQNQLTLDFPWFSSALAQTVRRLLAAGVVLTGYFWLQAKSRRKRLRVIVGSAEPPSELS